ncbi:MAG: LysM peptidoglycan-binding domain-containing protein [Chitinophagaceae bacterium]
MKKILFAAIFFFASYISLAQSGLQIKSNSKGLYVDHTVAAKETFYSIGRLYNISPKDIAAFNNVQMEGGLNIGQSLMIPLKDGNFSQSAAKGTPVYYTVGQGEGLYRVSVNSGKVALDNIRKWNSLQGDNVSPGQQLIVGYLVSAEMQAKPVVAKAEPAPAQPERREPVQQREEQRTETVRTEPVRTEPAPQPRTTSNNNNTSRTQVATGGSGYFKSQFEQQSRSSSAGRDVTVTSGIFKTSSGWQDAKYYALIDKVEPGTIVQVINPSNNKIIYAKVLGEMSGIRQNAGLELRISNAAASALEVGDTEKFIVRVAY